MHKVGLEVFRFMVCVTSPESLATPPAIPDHDRRVWPAAVSGCVIGRQWSEARKHEAQLVLSYSMPAPATSGWHLGDKITM